MSNAIGPETWDLPVPFRSEYWQSSSAGWQLNSADTCTSASIQLTNGTLAAANTCVRDTGSPGNSGAGCTAAASITNHKFLKTGVSGTDSNGTAGFAGNFNLWLAGSGAGHQGTVTVTATVPAWLQYNWSGTVSNPSAIATFGLSNGGPVLFHTEHF
jgi:MSHA biogenesis protein MshQ